MAAMNKSLAQMNKPSDVDKATKKHSALRDAAGRKGPNSTSIRSANLPRPSMAGAFSVGSMLQRQCELVHTSLAQLRVTLMVGNELNSTGNEMKALAPAIALLCVSSTVLAHDIYSNLRDRDGHLCCGGQDCKPV